MSNFYKKKKNQTRNWTNGKSSNQNKSADCLLMKAFCECLTVFFPNLTFNTAVFSAFREEDTGMQVISIKRGDELFFVTYISNKGKEEIHLTTANCVDGDELSCAIHGEEQFIGVFDYIVKSLNKGLSVKEILNTIDTPCAREHIQNMINKHKSLFMPMAA